MRGLFVRRGVIKRLVTSTTCMCCSLLRAPGAVRMCQLALALLAQALLVIKAEHQAAQHTLSRVYLLRGAGLAAFAAFEAALARYKPVQNGCRGASMLSCFCRHSSLWFRGRDPLSRGSKHHPSKAVNGGSPRRNLGGQGFNTEILGDEENTRKSEPVQEHLGQDQKEMLSNVWKLSRAGTTFVLLLHGTGQAVSASIIPPSPAPFSRGTAEEKKPNIFCFEEMTKWFWLVRTGGKQKRQSLIHACSSPYTAQPTNERREGTMGVSSFCSCPQKFVCLRVGGGID